MAMWNFVFLPEEKSRMCVYLFLFQGRSYQTKNPRISEDDPYGRKLKVLVPFLSDQKDWRAISPFPMSFAPQFVRSKFWDSYLVQLSWKVCWLCLWDNIPPPPAASGEKAFIYGIYPLFTFGICYWEIYNFLGGDFWLGLNYVESYPWRWKFSGWTFLGKFYSVGICQNFFTKFLLFVLLCLCRLNLTCEDVLRK